MSGFDTSDEEDDNTITTTPLQIDWLSLTCCGYRGELGITSLPGCRFKDTWRDLNKDIGQLQQEGIQEVFVLCTSSELHLYRVPRLLKSLRAARFTVHHFPFPDGLSPELPDLLKLLTRITKNLQKGRRTIIHCYGGLGRSGLVAACLLLKCCPHISEEEAVQKVRSVRGERAIQSIKQYNFIQDFRTLWKEHEKNSERSGDSTSTVK